MSANAFFFSHDFNARNNYKLLELRAEYGWEGYGIFWALCEVIAENDKPLPLNRLGAVSVSLGVSKEYLAGYIGLCIDLGIFIENEAGVTSEGLEKRLEHKREVSRKRSEAGKRSAQKRKEQQESNKSSTSVQQLDNKQNKTKQNKTIDNLEEADKSTPPKPKNKKAPKNAPEERLKTFKQSVRDAGSEIYTSEMLQGFYDYWTEPLQNSSKFRWESEKTWGIERRLSTWAKRSINFNESPYKPQVMKSDKPDKNQKQIDILIDYLSDPPTHHDSSSSKAEFKLLTGQSWEDYVISKK